MDADKAQSPDEELLVRSAAGVHSSLDVSTAVERFNGAARRGGASPRGVLEETVVIRQGGASVRDSVQNLFALMFPALFPWGRGDPDENRPVNVSRERCLAHYLLLSSRRFSQDSIFPLVAYDYTAKHTALAQA